MEMPKPGEAHARLGSLVGEWSGGETVHPAPWDPAGGTARGTVNNRAVLDGFAVVQEYQQFRAGRPNFAGHGIFWYDSASGEYVMTWIDSMAGAPANFRGGFDGDVLKLTNAMPQGGFTRCSFDCSEPGAYVFLMEVSQDGEQWMPAMEGTYARAAATAAPKRATAAPRKMAARKAKGAKKAPAKKAAAKRAAKPARKTAKAAVKRSAKKAARKAGKKAARKK